MTYSIASQDSRINIPPFESNYKIETSYKMKKTMLLIDVHPHMHLRGKANSIFIIDPKGVKKRIIGLITVQTINKIHIQKNM